MRDPPAPSVHVADHSRAELAAAELRRTLHLPVQVVRDRLGRDRAGHARLDQAGRFLPAQMVQHHDPRKDHAAGVDDILVCILRSRPVGGLEQSLPVADVRAGRQAQAAHLGGAGVREVVAVEVGRGNHVVLSGAQQDLLEHCVRDPILDQDLALWDSAVARIPDFRLCHAGIAEFLGRHLVAPIPERTLGEFLDVALVHQRHRRTAVVDGILDRGSDQAL